MNIKNDAGNGRCPTCKGRLMSQTGSSDLICFNCLDSDKPKTGHTIVVKENSTKGPTEDPKVEITLVREGVPMEQPMTVPELPVEVKTQPGDKCITITVSLEELETDHFIGTLLKKAYEALDELPAGTVKETKRVIHIQDRIDKETGSYA